MIRTRSLFAAIAILGVVTVHAAEVDRYPQGIEKFRSERVARLTAPDGWLSLIGLEWLKQGDNRVGSAADNDIVLTAGPAHLGAITLAKDGAMHMSFVEGSGALVDGKPAQQASTAMAAKAYASRTAKHPRASTFSASTISRSIRHGGSRRHGCLPRRAKRWRWGR
jgi:hypothetical protein